MACGKNDDKQDQSDPNPCEGLRTELDATKSKLATAETNLANAKIKMEAAVTDSTNAAKAIIQYEEIVFQNATYESGYRKACEDSGFKPDTKKLSEKVVAHRLAIERYTNKFPDSQLNETLLKLDEACDKYIVECTKPAPERDAVKKCEEEVKRCEEEVERLKKEVEQCEGKN